MSKEQNCVSHQYHSRHQPISLSSESKDSINIDLLTFPRKQENPFLFGEGEYPLMQEHKKVMSTFCK
jgi:hypothetical protein